MASNSLSPNPSLVTLGQGLRGSAAPAASSPFEPARTIGSSVIGTDLTILGQNITIISKNQLQSDGDIRGDVTGKQVTISADGSVIGTVSAEKIEVHGGVRGAIRAATVALHPSARVEAEIVHLRLSIAEGAQVEGSLKKSKSEAELVPNLDVSSYVDNTGAEPEIDLASLSGAEQS
jgi:cytoskeletal protein CcmA (bactofilin family)